MRELYRTKQSRETCFPWMKKSEKCEKAIQKGPASNAYRIDLTSKNATNVSRDVPRARI
jgi:hypothetical protein